MAWTSPMTAVANATFTAAQFNTHVRDNLNETAPAKATTAGRLFATSGVNSVVERAMPLDAISSSETTTSTSYTDLTTAGPFVVVTTGTTAVVFMSCEIRNDTAGEKGRMSIEITGASSISALDQRAVLATSSASGENYRLGIATKITGLTSGSNTFTCKYRVSGGTGTFSNRELVVLGL